MPNALVTNDTLLSEIDRQLAANGIDASIPGTFVNSTVEPLKNAIATVNSQLISFYNRNILELATGTDLDDIAAFFGVSRGYTGPLIDTSSDNFYVALKTGIASDYAADPTLPLTIPPEAVRIMDVQGNFYSILTPIVLDPNRSSSFVGIISHSDNRSVGAGQITAISVDPGNIINLDPTKADVIELICDNNRAINAETVALTDQELRDKCILRVNAMNNTNENAIRLALLELGITDVTFKRNMYGFGTIGVLVKIGGSANLSETTIVMLNNIIGNICPFAQVVVPELLRVRFVISAGFADANQIDAAKSEIFNKIREYFIALNPGDILDTDAILATITSIPGVINPSILCLYIDNTRAVVKKQYALPDQLFVLDPDEPIVYSQA